MKCLSNLYIYIYIYIYMHYVLYICIYIIYMYECMYVNIYYIYIYIYIYINTYIKRNEIKLSGTPSFMWICVMVVIMLKYSPEQDSLTDVYIFSSSQCNVLWSQLYWKFCQITLFLVTRFLSQKCKINHISKSSDLQQNI